MIIKIFKNVGKGSSKGPINYLLKEREPASEILSGSKEAVAFLIDNNHRANKYTSGVIAFRDNERPTVEQLNELLKDFRKTFLPNLDEDRAPVLIVRHIEKGNLELHFLIAKQDAKTGKALNIAPPGAQKLFEDFQKIQNDKMGFKQVTQNLLKTQFDTFEKNTRKAKIGSYLLEKVKKNELSTYSDLLRHLEQDLKIKVTKRGNDFITVLMPGKEKPVKLKGPAFTPGSDLRELLKKTDTANETLTPEKKNEILKSLNSGIEKRAAYNNKVYNSPNKSRALNFKSNSKLSKSSLTKTVKTTIKDVPRVAVSNSTKSFEESAPVPVSQKTSCSELSTSTHTNPSTSDKKASKARSGGSGGGGSGGGFSSIDIQISSLIAKMKSEKDIGKKAIIHYQLMALQVKKELQARQQHSDELKKK